MKNRSFTLIFIILFVLQISATVTMLPDIFIPIPLNYKGYVFIPYLLLIISYFSTKFVFRKSTSLYLGLMFIVLFLVGGGISVALGYKSIVSWLIYLNAFLIFFLVINTEKFFLHAKDILYVYGISAAISSFLVTLVFCFLFFNLIDINSWFLNFDWNEKFKLKREFLGDNVYSSPFFLTNIMVKTSKLALDINSNKFGAFCGFSYEASLGLLFSSVGVIVLFHFIKNRIVIFLTILFYCFHVVLGLSVTNLISIFVVVNFILIKKFKIFYGLILLLPLVYFDDLIFNVELMTYKFESRSFDDISDGVLSFFQGGIVGGGLWFDPESFSFPGIFVSLVMSFIYLMYLLIFLFLLKENLIYLGAAQLYLIIHSLKFPWIFIQLPFSMLVPILLFSYGLYLKKINNISYIRHQN